MTTETATEHRLAYEADQCVGVLRQEGATDTARVEVTWWEDDGSLIGYQRAGYLLVHVRCDHVPDDAPEALHADNHPASRAEAEAGNYLDQRGEARGWAGWEVSDVRAA